MLTAQQITLRSDRLGASEIPKLCGIVPYYASAPIDVWLEKTGLEPPRPPTHRTALGQILEPHIFEWWKSRQDATVTDGPDLGTVQDRRLEWLVATPDHVPFVLNRRARRRHRKIVECKFVGADVARSHWRDPLIVPDYVALQVQIQMRVLRIYKADVAVWLEGVRDDDARRIIPIPYDPNAAANALVIAERFYRENMLTGEPPEIDGSATWSRLLKEKFPRHVSETVEDAPSDAHELVAEYLRASREEKDAERRKSASKQRLCSIIGERAGIRDRAHDYRAMWKANKNGDRTFRVDTYGRGF